MNAMNWLVINPQALLLVAACAVALVPAADYALP